MRNVLIGALALMIGVASAQATITAWVTPVSDPALLPGLSAYKLMVVAHDQNEISAINNINLTGVHQASMGTPPSGQTPWTESWALQPAGLQLAQLANDTRMLLPADAPLGTDTLPDTTGSTPVETNDSTNPSGGAVPFEVTPGNNLPCALGIGTLSNTGGIGLDLANRNYVLEVAYVVVPSGPNTGHATLTASFGKSGNPFPDEATAGVDIPEPATMSLLALGGVAVLARKRRK